MVAVGGLAALSWEVLWQLQASLALGVSARGTAITLVATMTGITVGSLIGGRRLADPTLRPIRVYGVLEAVIGLSGLPMLPGFHLLERLDTSLYAVSPALAPALHAFGIVLLLGPATLAMGATIPVFARVASAHGASLAGLYGTNTVGAAAGSLLMAFLLIPWLGVSQTCRLVAGFNLCVFCGSRLVAPAEVAPRIGEAARKRPFAMTPATAAIIVFSTGFVTFGLEVAWFRALRAAFQSVTESFAIMLAAVLIPLGVAARLVPLVRRVRVDPAALLASAGVLILLATPFIERMDVLAWPSGNYAGLLLRRFGLALATLGPAMLLLGMVLPWLLEEYLEPRRCGWLYGINTAGSVVGALLAAWVLLPVLGFARACWLLGAAVVVLAAATQRGRARWVGALAGAGGLAFAVMQTSSLGRDRVLGIPDFDEFEIRAYDEGPDSTVSVVSDSSGARILVIDGFVTSSEGVRGVRYMEMMGRLPMLLHPDPRRALVICFGTGQTANAVRREEPAALDVVELNPAVLEMARYFTSNQNVLEDRRVRAIEMDGRAWLRRTRDRYDIVTLEPMPPYFAGVNALYSKEFYEIVADKLEPGGIVAQWLPFHLMRPFFAASAAATFQAVFRDAILWMHWSEPTGILLGRISETGGELGSRWPGFDRSRANRSHPPPQVRRSVVLDRERLARYAQLGRIITDDNQLLAYGPRRRQIDSRKATIENVKLVRRIARGATAKPPAARDPLPGRRGRAAEARPIPR
jgi:spermidine synthase